MGACVYGQGVGVEDKVGGLGTHRNGSGTYGRHLFVVTDFQWTPYLLHGYELSLFFETQKAACSDGEQRVVL